MNPLSTVDKLREEVIDLLKDIEEKNRKLEEQAIELYNHKRSWIDRHNTIKFIGIKIGIREKICMFLGLHYKRTFVLDEQKLIHPFTKKEYTHTIAYCAHCRTTNNAFTTYSKEFTEAI